MAGAYGDPGKPLPAIYAHPSATARLKVVHEVAAEVGGTPNQVVLAWLAHSDPPVIPIPGASSVAQLEEILAASDLNLDDTQLARLTDARVSS